MFDDTEKCQFALDPDRDHGNKWRRHTGGTSTSNTGPDESNDEHDRFRPNDGKTMTQT